MFEELLQRHERATIDRELLCGQLTAAIVNYSMSPPKKPAAPADFMPSELVKKRNRKLTKAEREAQREALLRQGEALVKALMEDESGKVRVQ